MALDLLQAGDVRKIVLARPAVEAGEKLGFLPGDLQEKVNPFLRPLYDALNDLLDFGQLKRYMARDIIEVVPLAYMRGRTLNHSFVILDEAQNTTLMQMKMFLTRLGMESRAVITGDITQADLPPGEMSGLVEAMKILKDVRGLTFVHLTKFDVVRHRIVQDIVHAYEEYEKRKRGRKGEEQAPAPAEAASAGPGAPDRAAPPGTAAACSDRAESLAGSGKSALQCSEP
jgi:phosphate starvation-inducible PhoH-like protein